MKKTLISVAVLSVVTAPLVTTSVQAQITNKSIYGTIDSGMRYSNKAGHDHLGNSKESRLSGNSGGLTGSHLGFKGQEDLGQGTTTIFNLEAGVNMSTGDSNTSSDTSIYGKKSENKSLFGRQAYLGIGHQEFGHITMGRQYSISYDVIKDFDPSNNINQSQTIHYLSGYADSKNNHNRSDNTIKYRHQLAGVTTLASYKSGNQVGSVTNGSEVAVGMLYKNSTWGVGASFTEIGISKMQDTAAAASQALGKTQIYNLAGEYKLNRFKFRTGFSQTKFPQLKVGDIFNHPQLAIPHRDQIGSTVFISAWGAQYDLSPKIELSLAQYSKLQYQSPSYRLMDKDKRTVLSSLYKLSKRTDIYGFMDWHSNRAGVSETNKSKNQQSITAGLRHSF